VTDVLRTQSVQYFCQQFSLTLHLLNILKVTRKWASATNRCWV